MIGGTPIGGNPQMVIVHSYVNVYQRLSDKEKIDYLVSGLEDVL